MPDMLEQVARAIAIAAIARKWPNAKPDFIADKVDHQWKDYKPDARLVINTINKMVEAEQFADEVNNLPQTPITLLQ